MKWVKIKEKKPEINGDEEILFRDLEGAKVLVEFWKGDVNLGDIYATMYEWLDESPEPQEELWEELDTNDLGKLAGLTGCNDSTPLPTPETYEQEAEAMYKIEEWEVRTTKVWLEALRTAHITACNMRREELEAKDREIERLKGLVRLAFGTDDYERWQQFAKEHNL